MMATRSLFDVKQSVDTASPVWLQLDHWLWKHLFLLKPKKDTDQLLTVLPPPVQKVVSDDDATAEPVLLNTDITQIKHSWQELNCSPWDAATLIESTVSGAEAGSADPKWSWFWSLSSWEMRWVSRALNKPNVLRHFNLTEKTEESETHTHREIRGGKKEHADSDAEEPGH